MKIVHFCSRHVGGKKQANKQINDGVNKHKATLCSGEALIQHQSKTLHLV